MFFRRASKKDKNEKKISEPEVAAEAAPEAKPETAPANDTAPDEKASAASSSPAASDGRVDPKKLGFETTAELEPSTAPLGQTRALESLDFGIGMKGQGYNIRVIGPNGSGRRKAMRAKLEEAAKESATPADWVYVRSFDAAGGFRALKFNPTDAKRFCDGFSDAIDQLAEALPAAFGADDYEIRRGAIEEEFRFAREDALEALRRRVEEQNIAILRTPAGIAVAPILEGKVVSIDVFNSVPEALRKEVQAKISSVEAEVETILKATPAAEKARRERLAALNEQVAGRQVRAVIDEFKEKFANVDGVASYLSAAARDLVRNAGLFIKSASSGYDSVAVPISTAGDLRFTRYRTHLMAAHESAQGAPIVHEPNPTYANLFGRIECSPADAGQSPQIVRIKPGALHRANGGFLLLDARALVDVPEVTRAFRHALEENEIRFDPPADPIGPLGGEIPDLEPIPLNVKVLIFGDEAAHHELAAIEPELQRLFKVEAVFENAIERSSETVAQYARLIAGLVQQHGLKPLDAASVAMLIDAASEQAGGNGHLSLEVGRLADMCREADHWSGAAGRAVTSVADVERVLLERNVRVGGTADRSAA